MSHDPLRDSKHNLIVLITTGHDLKCGVKTVANQIGLKNSLYLYSFLLLMPYVQVRYYHQSCKRRPIMSGWKWELKVLDYRIEKFSISFQSSQITWNFQVTGYAILYQHLELVSIWALAPLTLYFATYPHRSNEPNGISDLFEKTLINFHLFAFYYTCLLYYITR